MDSVIIRGMWGEKHGLQTSNQTLKTEGPKTGSALTPTFMFLSFLCQLFSPGWLTLHK